MPTPPERVRVRGARVRSGSGARGRACTKGLLSEPRRPRRGSALASTASL